MTQHTIRPDRYYNALVGRGRHQIAPTMREASSDLRQAARLEARIHAG